MILHIRIVDEDVIKILGNYKNKLNSVIYHCFNQGLDIADTYTKELRFMLGIGGALLQDNYEKLEQTVGQTPLEYLILETDGLYVKLTKPENITGKKWKKARNISLMIPDVARKIARLKNIDVSDVERITTENVIRCC